MACPTLESVGLRVDLGDNVFGQFEWTANSPRRQFHRPYLAWPRHGAPVGGFRAIDENVLTKDLLSDQAERSMQVCTSRPDGNVFGTGQRQGAVLILGTKKPRVSS